jgi:hypothetical protein
LVQKQFNYTDDNAQINQLWAHLEDGLEVDTVAKAQFCKLVSLPTFNWQNIPAGLEKNSVAEKKTHF